MSEKGVRTCRRIFGTLGVLLFCTFTGNLLLAKFAIVEQMQLPRLPALAEFLVLLFAAAMLVAYAACLRNDGGRSP